LNFWLKSHTKKKLDARNAEAGPTMAADEKEEEYARLENGSFLAGNARELSAQVTWDARMEDFMLDAVVLLGGVVHGGD
jgi:hypothetical protein